MRKVTKDEFYKAVGPQNVHPRVDVSTFKDEMHVSTWEHLETRAVVGMTKSSSWGRTDLNEYYLT